MQKLGGLVMELGKRRQEDKVSEGSAGLPSESQTACYKADKGQKVDGRQTAGARYHGTMRDELWNGIMRGLLQYKHAIDLVVKWLSGSRTTMALLCWYSAT